MATKTQTKQTHEAKPTELNSFLINLCQTMLWNKPAFLYLHSNLVAFAFQPHVYGDEGCAEDECQYCYKCDAGKI